MPLMPRTTKVGELDSPTWNIRCSKCTDSCRVPLSSRDLSVHCSPSPSPSSSPGLDLGACIVRPTDDVIARVEAVNQVVYGCEDKLLQTTLTLAFGEFESGGVGELQSVLEKVEMRRTGLLGHFTSSMMTGADRLSSGSLPSPLCQFLLVDGLSRVGLFESVTPLQLSLSLRPSLPTAFLFPDPSASRLVNLVQGMGLRNLGSNSTGLPVGSEQGSHFLPPPACALLPRACGQLSPFPTYPCLVWYPCTPLVLPSYSSSLFLLRVPFQPALLLCPPALAPLLLNLPALCSAVVSGETDGSLPQDILGNIPQLLPALLSLLSPLKLSQLDNLCAYILNLDLIRRLSFSPLVTREGEGKWSG